MNGKKESANLTRECITTALFMLSEEKPYNEITITDIAERAGVSRMAYYRNYKSKEDIIYRCLEERSKDFIEVLKNKSINLRTVLEVVGDFFCSNMPLIKSIVNAGLVDESMGYMYSTLRRLFPDIESSKKNEYDTTFYIGGVIFVYRMWMESGMKEDVSEIADIIINNISDEIEEKYNSLKAD